MRAPSSRHDLGGALAHGGIVDQQAAPLLPAEKQVLRDGQIVGEQDLLVDQHHALLLGRDRPGEADRRALPAQFAFARLQMSAQNAHQRGFARAVLADHRMDTAGLKRQRNAVQHLVGAERLGDALRLQDWHHRQRPKMSKTRRQTRNARKTGNGKGNGQKAAGQPLEGLTGITILP